MLVGMGLEADHPLSTCKLLLVRAKLFLLHFSCRLSDQCKPEHMSIIVCGLSSRVTNGSAIHHWSLLTRSISQLIRGQVSVSRSIGSCT